MKRIKLSFLFLLCALFFANVSFAIDDEKTQRIKVSYLMALGRRAQDAEVNYWKNQPNYSLGQYMDRHRAFIAAGNQIPVIEQAYIDAMGRRPSDGEKNYWKQYNQTYTELMKAHVNWIRGGNEFDEVIKRAFRYVRGSNPDAEELAAWKNKGVKSYVVLVGLLQEARAKAGTKKLLGFWEDLVGRASYALSYVVVNFTIAKEANSIIGNDAGSMVAAGAGNVKATMDLIGSDGATIVAAGAGNIVAAGAGN